MTPDPRGELLPRRLLDLSGGQIRLIETAKGQRGRYIALSHCWGPPPRPLDTRRETIAERMRGIPMTQLPRTFQDAVTITRALGLHYIWIDSLCIIQGPDLADWEEQSAVMADIYSRCYLNLATTRTGGPYEGYSSHEAMQTPRWIRLHQDTAPLLPRGWVYQERSLSPRSVHMHSNEIAWSCKVEQRCECGGLDGSPKALHGLWRTVVQDYTLLDLFKELDRLPGLSGLAYRFAEYFPKNERYLAGLWESDLARDLLWESGGSMQMSGPTREKVPGVPSWSWASLK
ncbi:hypothetical protein M422DRAFT_165674, partial [Sphaerobolus stellatus SS14]